MTNDKGFKNLDMKVILPHYLKKSFIILVGKISEECQDVKQSIIREVCYA